MKPEAVTDYELECQMLNNYFGENFAGIFAEVGSNHPRIFNLTYPLELNGWTGLLIEPIPELARLLRQNRVNSTVCQCACSSPDKTGTAQFYIEDNRDGPSCDLDTTFGGASGLKKNVDDFSTEYSRTIFIECITLSQLLENNAIETLDLLIIDTEGTELDVLEGAKLGKCKPRLILIEDKFYSLEKHFYLKKRGYKLWKHFNWNSWYVPAQTHVTPLSLKDRFKLFRKMYLGLPFRRIRRLLKDGRF